MTKQEQFKNLCKAALTAYEKLSDEKKSVFLASNSKNKELLAIAKAGAQ